MRLIAIEEHHIDPAIDLAAKPLMDEEAPYFKFKNFSASGGGYGARNKQRPVQQSDKEIFPLAVDLGELRIRTMDEHGIDVQVVSNNSPIQLVPKSHGPAMARDVNDRLAKAVAEHPKRLSAFAILPWQDPEAALGELNRAILGLGLKGVLIVGRPDLGSIFLDDPRYEPVLRRMHELKVPLYVHPWIPAPDVQKTYYSGFSEELTAQFSLTSWGWHNEAGVQVLRMLLSGMFERLPDLQVISGHWGEMVPFYLARLDDMAPKAATGLSRTVSESYRANVWVTPSGMFDLPHFEFIYKVVGPDRIMWSNDYPFVTLDGTREFLDKLFIPDEDMKKITHLNAEKLFRL